MKDISNAGSARATARAADDIAAPVRVVVLDDHASLREMLAFVLRLEGGYEVVGEAGGGVEGLRVCRAVSPNVVILDLALPELCGVQLIRVLREELRDLRILVYSGTADAGLVDAALAAGPDGFVRKEDSLVELRAGLAAVARGGQHFSPGALAWRGRARGAGLEALVADEVAVLQMLSEGMQNKEIAEVLGTTAKQVDHFRQRLMRKLDIHDVASLTRFALRHHVGVS